MSLSNQQVLITGATGFLGSALARRLLADGANVRAVVRSPQKAAPLCDLGIEIVAGDVTNADSMRRAVEGCSIVFHAAAAMSGDYAKQREVNVKGTRNLVQAAAQAEVTRFVHVSSVAVYGYNASGDRREDMPPPPTDANPYAASKAATEQVVTSGSVPYTIIRPAMIYGAGSINWTGGLFRLAKLKPTPFIGSGSGSAFPIHVDDVRDLLVLSATHPAAVNQIFNCAPDPAPTWREFVGAYSRLAGHQSWLSVPPILFSAAVAVVSLFSPPISDRRSLRDQVGFIQRKVTYKTTKACDLLGWTPKYTLETGIPTCVPWLRERGLLK